MKLYLILENNRLFSVAHASFQYKDVFSSCALWICGKTCYFERNFTAFDSNLNGHDLLKMCVCVCICVCMCVCGRTSTNENDRL